MPTVEEYNELINNSEIEIKEDVETELSIKLYRMLTWSKKNGAYLSFNRSKILRSTDNSITTTSVIRWLSSCSTITSQGQTIKYPNGFYVYNDGYDLDCISNGILALHISFDNILRKVDLPPLDSP